MKLNSIKQKMRADAGAMGSTETILLIALSVFAVLAIGKFIIAPMTNTARKVGVEIEQMGP